MEKLIFRDLRKLMLIGSWQCWHVVVELLNIFENGKLKYVFLVFHRIARRVVEEFSFCI